MWYKVHIFWPKMLLHCYKIPLIQFIPYSCSHALQAEYILWNLLQEMPYDKDDDVIKATSFEVISTLRDVLKTNTLWKDQVQTYTQVLPCFLNLPLVQI